MAASSGKAIGGKARSDSLTPERRKEIAQKAAAARAAKRALPRATHGSVDHPIRIGEIEIPCYVLSDGTRVLAQRGMQESLGLSSTGGSGLSRFTSSKALSSHINKDLAVALESPILFTTPRGGSPITGYPATVLPDLVDAVVDAWDAGDLGKQQEHIVAQCQILARGLMRVGIIALVDEATGYQKDRARDALAKILEEYVAKELQPWVRTFDSNYYEQMFRLRGLPYPPDSANYRPRYFGTLTNDIVYSRLAPGVLDALKIEAKKSERASKLHQHLTAGFGRQELLKHLGSVVTLMKISQTWGQFMMTLNQVSPRYGDTYAMDLERPDR